MYIKSLTTSKQRQNHYWFPGFPFQGQFYPGGGAAGAGGFPAGSAGAAGMMPPNYTPQMAKEFKAKQEWVCSI